MLNYEFGTRDVGTEEEYYEKYYFTPFDGERQAVFETQGAGNVYTNIVGTKKPFIEKIGSDYIVKIWDQSNNSISEICTLTEKQNNFRFEGLLLSPDAKYLYLATAYNNEDWNDNQFNLSGIDITTEILKINIDTNEVVELFKSNGGPEYYSIQYATESYLIIAKSIVESDWHKYMIFDNDEKNIVKEFEEGWLVTALSPNNKYFAYNFDLFSKAGNYDPSGIKIMNIESFEEIPVSYLSQHDFRVNNSSVDGTWINYLSLFWGADNKSLFMLRQDAKANGLYDYSVHKIDLATQRINELFRIPDDIGDVSLIGVYKDRVLIKGIQDNKEKIWQFPGNIVLYQSNLYELNYMQIVTDSAK